MLPQTVSRTQGSALDSHVTAALVRLAHRVVLPLQLYGASAHALPETWTAPKLAQCCVGFLLKVRATVQLDLVSTRSDNHKKPAWLLQALLTDTTTHGRTELHTLLQLDHSHVHPCMPFSQWVAALDVFEPSALQQKVWRKLTTED